VITVHGLVVTVAVAAGLLLVASIGGLAVAMLWIHEELYGGDRGAGCRRSRCGSGGQDRPRVAELARGDFHDVRD